LTGVELQCRLGPGLHTTKSKHEPLEAWGLQHRLLSCHLTELCHICVSTIGAQWRINDDHLCLSEHVLYKDGTAHQRRHIPHWHLLW
jgi:hypothetical protein